MEAFTGSERFLVRRRLGAGSMGAVYQALDRETGGEVAIKVLGRPDPAHIQRFKNEFRRLADLSHPNLVRLGELYNADGRWFFTMELVLGGDLLHFTRPPPLAHSPDDADAPTIPPVSSLPYDEARLRAAMRQLAVGIAALHAAQIVHRDIKPSNVLATTDGRVVLLDFGLATPTTPGHRSLVENVVGTVAYMAPEQAAGKPASPSADWYSVGVVLYEALTGRLPFLGSGIDLLMNKQRFEPPPPRQIVPLVPADLDALCTSLLRFDPGERPEAGEILARLGVVRESNRSGARPTLGSHVAELVGREAELDQLEEVIAGRGEEPLMISLRGASGVGKSALARELCMRYTQNFPDALLLTARCYERESLPYKAFDGIVDGLSHTLSNLNQVDAAQLLPEDAALIGRLFPSLRQVPAMTRVVEPRLPNPQESRKRAFAALRQLLVRLSSRQPVLLSIDDFQWADTDSLALLGELLRAPSPPALVVLATVRDGAEHSWSPPDGCRHHRLDVTNLDPEASRLLAQQLLAVESHRPDLDLEAISAEAGGHPLFIQELVRHATSGHRAASEHLTLDEALWARIAELEAPAQRLLEIVSVASGPLPQKAAFLAAEVSGADGQRWAGLLRVARLARTTGTRDTDRIEPYHDRVRESVLAHLDGEAARAHHRRIAIGLDSVGGATSEPQALVFHLAAAGDAERARALAVRAAESAEEGLAFDRAARFYLQAIELGHADASALWTRRGEALAAAGRGRVAADAFLSAATSAPDAAVALEGRRRAAEQLIMSGHIADGMATLRTVLDAIGVQLPATSRGALVSLVWRRALIRLRGLRFRLGDASELSPKALSRVDICASVAKGLSVVDTLRGADFQARHLTLALRTGEPARIARALALEAGYSAIADEAGGERAARVLRMAEKLSARTTSPWAGAIVLGTWTIVHYQRGRWRQALQNAELAERRMREQCTGVAWELDTNRLFYLYALYYLGQLRELGERVPDSLYDAEERGDLYGATNMRVGVANSAWLVRGDVGAARAATERAARDWTSEGFHVQHYHQVLARANIELYAGDVDAAHAVVENSWPAYAASHLSRVEVVRIEALHLRGRVALAVAAAQPEKRKLLVKRVRKMANELLGEAPTWGRVLGKLLLAACEALDGQNDAAVARLTVAVREMQQIEMGAYAAMTSWSLARLLGGHEGELGEAELNRWAEVEGVTEPDRWRAMLAPGLP